MSDYGSIHVFRCCLCYLSNEGSQLSLSFGQELRHPVCAILYLLSWTIWVFIVYVLDPVWVLLLRLPVKVDTVSHEASHVFILTKVNL